MRVIMIGELYNVYLSDHNGEVLKVTVVQNDGNERELIRAETEEDIYENDDCYWIAEVDNK